MAIPMSRRHQAASSPVRNAVTVFAYLRAAAATRCYGADAAQKMLNLTSNRADNISSLAVENDLISTMRPGKRMQNKAFVNPGFQVNGKSVRGFLTHLR